LSFAKREIMQNKKAQREQMMLMIADWQSSGLNQRAYCAAAYSTQSEPLFR